VELELELALLVLWAVLKRVGRDSLVVNGGRTRRIVATSMACAAAVVAMRNLLGGPPQPRLLGAVLSFYDMQRGRCRLGYHGSTRSTYA
jgi:hypothetical protein